MTKYVRVVRPRISAAVRIQPSASNTNELQITTAGHRCNRRSFHPQCRGDSQIGRLRFCTAEKFRKEKRADTKNRKQNEAFVEH